MGERACVGSLVRGRGIELVYGLVVVSNATCTALRNYAAHLVTKLEAQSKLVGTLYLPVLAEFVLDCVAQRRAVVIL